LLEIKIGAVGMQIMSSYVKKLHIKEDK